MLRYRLEPPRATLVIDDPARHNPLSTDVMDALRQAVDDAAVEEAARVIVITGAGDRAFSAGGDLAEGFVDEPLARHAARGALADLLRSLRGAGKPTIAAVNGHALGGGFGLACSCDIVLAADHATFGSPEIDVGLWAMMITPAVVRAIGPKPALEMMLTGRRISADEALRMGLASRVVPADQLDALVDETAALLAAKSAATLRLGRDAFYAGEYMPFDAALDYFQNGLTAVALTEDATEGIAAFNEKRDPEWKGS